MVEFVLTLISLSFFLEIFLLSILVDHISWLLPHINDLVTASFFLEPRGTLGLT